MCSWCWGFRPVWERVRSRLPEGLEVIRRVGGLAPDSDEPMPEEMRQFLQQTWRRIQQRIPGTEFNFDFWRRNTPRRSTWPACRAVIAARRMGGDAADERMTHGIQKAYYLEARNPSDRPVLADIAEETGLDREAFEAWMNGPEIETLLQRELAGVRALGIDGFPSLRIEKDGFAAHLPIDYNHPETLLRAIREFLEGASENPDFFASARKHRAQNRSVYAIHEDSSTELTPQSRKKTIFRGALEQPHGQHD